MRYSLAEFRHISWARQSSAVLLVARWPVGQNVDARQIFVPPKLILKSHCNMRSLVCASTLLLVLALSSSAAGADKDPLKVPLGLKPVPVPADNPLTIEKVELGKQLYFDPRLSCDETVSCASCHDPKKGWSNGTPFATGVRNQVGGRSAPTIINAAYSE